MRANPITATVPAPPLVEVSYSCASGDGYDYNKLAELADTLHLSMHGCSRGCVRFSQGPGTPFTFLEDKQVDELIADLQAIRETSRRYIATGIDNELAPREG